MASFAFLLCHFEGLHFDAVANYLGKGASKVLLSEAANFKDDAELGGVVLFQLAFASCMPLKNSDSALRWRVLGKRNIVGIGFVAEVNGLLLP
jgi:hypothetical protein